MKAIILAAGKSSRLYPLTLDKPKCLLEIEKGKTILEYQVEILKKLGITEILVIAGYLKERIFSVLGNSVSYRNFSDFEKYNNLHTLYSIKDKLNEDSLILFSDVILSKNLLKKCADSKEDFCLLINNKEILEGTMRVKIRNNSIVDIGNHIPVKEADGNFIGVAKFSKKGVSILLGETEKVINNPQHNNDYYTYPLTEIAKKNKISFELTGEEPWIEIDFLKDYEEAKEIYSLIKSH